MNKLQNILLLFCLCLCGCTTYLMSVSSLKQQLGKVNDQTIKQVYDFRMGVLVGVTPLGGICNLALFFCALVSVLLC